jgi:hypothetical protein
MPDMCEVYWPTAGNPPASMAPAMKVRAIPSRASAAPVLSDAMMFLDEPM